jgi:hypothetical protein
MHSEVRETVGRLKLQWKDASFIYIIEFIILQVRVTMYFLCPKIYAKVSQRKLMYLVKDLDHIHSFLLTNFCLYFGTDGVTNMIR